MSRVCGRWTRRGGRCGRELRWFEPACPQHATAAELDQVAENLRIEAELRRNAKG